MDTLNTSNTCFFTGHRFIAYDTKSVLRCKIKQLCTDLILYCGVTDFISGGALGFDTLAALTVLELKKEYPMIRLHLFLPCTDQADKWRAYDKEVWQRIKSLADDCVYITKSTYISGCMQLRNKAMVDNSLYGIAYCTRNFGGTFSTLNYAKSKNRNVSVISDI